MDDVTVEVGLLGPVQLTVRGRLAPVSSRKQRALIAVLALRPSEAVSIERIAEALWGEHPPATARNTIEAYVSRLRRLLAANGAPTDVLATEPPGYSLRGIITDVERFEQLRAAGLLREALALWRGQALGDLDAESSLDRERAVLEDLRLETKLDLVDTELAAGRAASVTHELEAAVREHPFQERPRRQLMVALYRVGRQADALAFYRETRRLFSDELGLEPSPELKRLEQAILRHDPALWPPGEPTTTVGAPRRRRPWVVAAVASAALVLAALAAAFATRSSEPPTLKRPQPLGERLQASLSIAEPSCCAFSPNAVWVVGHHDGTLYEIDPRRNRIIGRYPVAGFQAEAPLDAAGSLWIPSVGSGKLVRFDPQRKKVIAKIPVQGGQIAWGYLSIWVTTRNHQLDRINIRTNKVVRRLSLAPGYNDFDDDVEVGYGSVWCTVTDASTLVRVDPATNSVTARITGFGNTESWMPIAVGAGSVWAARVTGDYEILYRIDPATNRIAARIRVGRRGAAWPNGFITVADGYVWTGNWDATISQIDPDTNRVVGWYRIPEHPEELAYGDRSLWVAYYDISRIQRIQPTG